MKHKNPNQGQQKKSQPALNTNGVQPENSNNKKDKLACLFYSLASIYYILQLSGKILEHINMPMFNLADIFSPRIIDYALQGITILLIFLKKK